MALLLVLLLDAAVFPRAIPWNAVVARVSGDWLLQNGIARDRALLSSLGHERGASQRVFLVGSSRLQAAFVPALFGRDAERAHGIEAVKLTHAGIDVFAIRSLADEIARYAPDRVVILLSEFDTHAPPRPDPVASFGSLSAIAELASGIGPRRVFAERVVFERLLAVALLDLYRYRTVFQRAGLDRLRHFDWGENPTAQDFAQVVERSELMPPGAVDPLDPLREMQLLRELADSYRGQNLWGAVQTTKLLRKLSSGPHVELHRRLVRSAVERLRASGAEVLLVEGPLSPMASEFYDLRLREEFRAFARELARVPGVDWLPSDAIGVFVESDFVDLSHASTSGARKLTGALLRRLQAPREPR